MLASRFRLRNSPRLLVGWMIWFTAVLVSCAPATSDRVVAPSVPPAATRSASPASQARPTPLPSRAPGGITTLVQQAVADLAARLGVSASEIEVVSAEAVTWNDGSLGCPQPGMAYIQVLIDGFRVILKHGDRLYDYHAGPSSIFLCERPLAVPKLTPAPNTTIVLPPPIADSPERFLVYGMRTPDSATPPGGRAAEQYQKDVVAAAIAHLASRLGVRNNAIHLVSSGYTEAQIASPCGSTAKTDATRGIVAGGLSMGYEVVLKVGDDDAQHRSVALGGLGRFAYCGEISRQS